MSCMCKLVTLSIRLHIHSYNGMPCGLYLALPYRILTPLVLIGGPAIFLIGRASPLSSVWVWQASMIGSKFKKCALSPECQMWRFEASRQMKRLLGWLTEEGGRRQRGREVRQQLKKAVHSYCIKAQWII